MISALSGSNALSLLSVFGRSQATGGAEQTRAAQRPPPPPPPTSQGNGASAQSIFEALASGDTSSIEDLISGLDGDQDGKLNASELTQAFQGSGDALGQMVSNIIANLDSDGDQAVSGEELQSGLESLAASGPHHHGGPPPGGSAGSASDAASSLVSGLDTDGDGKLSAEELAAAFETKDTASTPQKSLQEMLFGLLLDQKVQDQTSQAASLYAA